MPRLVSAPPDGVFVRARLARYARNGAHCEEGRLARRTTHLAIVDRAIAIQRRPVRGARAH